MQFQAQYISTEEVYDVFWWSGLFEDQQPFVTEYQGPTEFSQNFYKLKPHHFFVDDKNRATSEYLEENKIVLEKNQFVVWDRGYNLKVVGYDNFLLNYKILDSKNSVKSDVVLLSKTENIIDTLYLAARQCYYAGFVGDFDSESVSKEKKLQLVKHVLDSGHHSVFEHVYFTFAINNVSRAESHQHVRHRIASYSQQSQRYCGINTEEFEYILPPAFETNEQKFEFMKCIDRILTSYNILKKTTNIKNEDLRYLLPNAAATKFVTTLNIRSLFNFLGERMCKCAQWEIRDVARKIHKILKEEFGEIFNDIGPRCYQLGYCPENEKRTCGLRPLKIDFLK